MTLPRRTRLLWPFIASGRTPAALLGASVAAVCATALSQVSTPWLIGRLIDSVTGSDRRGLEFAAVGIALAGVCGALGGGGRAIAAQRLGDLFSAHLRLRLVAHVLALPVQDVEGRNRRELSAVFGDDVGALARAANPLLLNVALATLQLMTAVTLITLQYSAFGWVALVVVPLNVALGLWHWPLARRRASEARDAKTRLDTLTSEIGEGVRDIKCLAAERRFLDRARSLARDELAIKKANHLWLSLNHGRYAIERALTALVYFVGGRAVMQGQMTVGELTAFVWYVGFLDTPISELWKSAQEWQLVNAARERVGAILALEPERGGQCQALSSRPLQLELRNLSFTYRGAGASALESVNMCVPAGARVGVVGPSGAGKTTLVALLVGLLSPDRGDVMLDGRDIREFNLETLRRHVALVSQEPVLFEGTIRDNICAAEEAGDDSVTHAAQLAHAHDFITGLPDGYNTMLGPGGEGLSGGQKRRIAIARALLGHPQIIIFDEVTGSLDSISDSRVRDAIEELAQRCTTITISHRLSSTASADLIYVLDQGHVVGCGTHNELVGQCSLYQRLVEGQEMSRIAVAEPS